VWPDLDALGRLVRRGARYEPGVDPAELTALRADWSLALRRALLH